MHPLKLNKIENPFGFLQSSPQMLAEQVGPIFFIENMFSCNTLICTLMIKQLIQITLQMESFSPQTYSVLKPHRRVLCVPQFMIV